jgi:Tol biopolymer transport system component
LLSLQEEVLGGKSRRHNRCVQNGVIAWADNGNEILAINAHGRTHAIVRYGTAPAWSPDGRKMAYVGGYFASRLHVINANGTHNRRLPVNFDASEVSTPSWSPNGTAIAFTGAPGGTEHVYVVNADGSGLRQLTNGDEDSDVAWSPASKQIEFVRGVSNTAVYVMNADGSDQRKLAEGGGFLGSPAWSPDGTKIAFTGNRGGVYVMKTDGSDQRKLAEGDSPAWSSDGTKIAFVGTGGIYVMNADGSGQRKLAHGDQPTWSPDGTKIAFENGLRFSRSNGIYVINADGSARRRLNHLGYGGQALTIAWQPLSRGHP